MLRIAERDRLVGRNSMGGARRPEFAFAGKAKHCSGGSSVLRAKFGSNASMPSLKSGVLAVAKSTSACLLLGKDKPADKEILVIADNLSAHKTKLVSEFLVEHPDVRLHYTPTFSSWLNQIENWFYRIQRHVITLGGFTSIANLRSKLMRYTRHYNKTAAPILWTYSDLSKRIKS
jgi:transposase